MVVALALFLAVDGLLFYRYQQSLPSAEESATSQPNTEVRADAAKEEATVAEEAAGPEEAMASPTEEEEEANALRVVVRVVGSPAWLMIQEDGLTVLEEVSEPGFSGRFEADREIVLRTGNAGAVWVEVNGRDLVPLGASGETRTVRLVRESES